MATNFEWGAGEMEDSFESLGEQETYGGNGEASYYEQERNGPQSGIYGEAEGGYAQGGQEAESVFDETEEMELAADMLSLGSEMELDQAIGKVMHSAARAVGGSISRDVGMALGSAIKAAAQQAAEQVVEQGGRDRGGLTRVGDHNPADEAVEQRAAVGGRPVGGVGVEGLVRRVDHGCAVGGGHEHRGAECGGGDGGHGRAASAVRAGCGCGDAVHVRNLLGAGGAFGSAGARPM